MNLLLNSLSRSAFKIVKNKCLYNINLIPEIHASNCTKLFSTEASPPIVNNPIDIPTKSQSSKKQPEHPSNSHSNNQNTISHLSNLTSNGDSSSTDVSFSRLLRTSALMQMGDPEGAIVKGVIVEIMDDNLFIDFGGKFLAVCRKPRYKSDAYRRGTGVVLQLNDLELASIFMGSSKGITLLEADATLLGLADGKAGGRSLKMDQRMRGQGKEKKRWNDEIFVGEVVEDGDDGMTNRQEVRKLSRKASGEYASRSSSDDGSAGSSADGSADSSVDGTSSSNNGGSVGVPQNKGTDNDNDDSKNLDSPFKKPES